MARVVTPVADWGSLSPSLPPSRPLSLTVPATRPESLFLPSLPPSLPPCPSLKHALAHSLTLRGGRPWREWSRQWQIEGARPEGLLHRPGRRS